jgi:hypothetical protein
MQGVLSKEPKSVLIEGFFTYDKGARGSVVGWGIMLQGRRFESQLGEFFQLA